MTQKIDPFISSNWGWDNGENGWGEGMNENLIQYAFFHNNRINGILANASLLPASPVNGDAYFTTADTSVYFRAEGQWYSAVPPIGKIFIVKGTEVEYKFNGATLVVDATAISEVTGLQAALDGKVDDSQVGAVNGVAPLGADQKVPSAYLPESGSYQGTWNANTNNPTIVSSVGSSGDFYIVSVAGSTTIDGISVWAVGDQIRFDGTVWQKIPNSQLVSSVNGETGSVILDATDVGATPSTHVGSGGSQHANATTSVAGFLSSADKVKLDGIASGATANQTDAYLLSRANHTGTQAQSTVTSLTTDLAAKQATLVSGTNIKTINGSSILGSGDIVISGGGGGSTSFTGLTDTPSSYTGNAEKAVIVKLDESGLEFVTLGTAAFSDEGDFATSSHTHSDATTSLAGFMSAADKTKLNNLALIASSGSATDLVAGTVPVARMPAFSGDVVVTTGTTTTSLSTTGIAAGTYKSLTIDAKGRATAGSNPTTFSGFGIVDILDNLSDVFINANTSGEILKWNGTNWINNTLAEAGIQPVGSYLTGNQTITLGGDVSGSGATSITVTLDNTGVTAGTYKSVTVDAKGRVTAGTNPTTFAGFGIVDTLNALSDVVITSVAAGELVRWNGTSWVNATLAEAGIQAAGSYLTGNQTITLGGDVSGSGTTSITVTLDSTGVTAASYGTSIAVPTIAVDAKGRITSAANTTIRTGTTAQTGVLQLTDSVTSTSATTAATPKNVKAAYDLAATKMDNAPLNIEVGRVDGTAGSTYIDFHTSASVVDYDARILVSGGTGVNSSGAVNLYGASFVFNAAITCTTWTATSDRTLKENIEELPLAKCKEILAKVNWCSFDLIGGQKNLNGVIAQELIEIYPDAVSKDELTGKYSVNYNLLYNLQMRVNQDLENRLARLEEILLEK